ncbi:hypothetical protein ACIBW9_24045 [Streptomyces sp. NPDC049541]|uniref:hypothetical protein n=1 Tax=Streptomyces sp. NPDC049541 TaxID=3365594 RepID=UPI003795527D
MNTRGRTLKYTAVIGFVVLSLTGFSGRHHGIGKHHHSSGGCSSSSQDHDTSSHTTTTTGGSGSYASPSTAASLSPAMAVLLKCATVQQPYATVEVSNPNDTAGTFEVTVTFRDAKGGAAGSRVDMANVPAHGTATVRVNVGGSNDLVARIKHCEVADQAPAAS